MIINQQSARTVDENEDLVFAYDGNRVYPSAMFDNDNFYANFEIGFSLTLDKEQDFIKQVNKGTFTQFKDQVVAFLGVR